MYWVNSLRLNLLYVFMPYIMHVYRVWIDSSSHIIPHSHRRRLRHNGYGWELLPTIRGPVGSPSKRIGVPAIEQLEKYSTGVPFGNLTYSSYGHL